MSVYRNVWCTIEKLELIELTKTKGNKHLYTYSSRAIQAKDIRHHNEVAKYYSRNHRILYLRLAERSNNIYMKPS